jgi:hypothetical protein
MLYDPKWEKQTETKADPFALGTLIAWLEKQPASETYCYENTGGCLMHKYFTDCGLKDVSVGGTCFSHSMNFRKIDVDMSYEFSDVAASRPHTFGAALERARAAAR